MIVAVVSILVFGLFATVGLFYFLSSKEKKEKGIVADLGLGLKRHLDESDQPARIDEASKQRLMSMGIQEPKVGPRSRQKTVQFSIASPKMVEAQLRVLESYILEANRQLSIISDAGLDNVHVGTKTVTETLLLLRLLSQKLSNRLHAANSELELSSADYSKIYKDITMKIEFSSDAMSSLITSKPFEAIRWSELEKELVRSARVIEAAVQDHLKKRVC